MMKSWENEKYKNAINVQRNMLSNEPWPLFECH